MTIPLPPLPSPRPPRPSDDEPKTDPHLHAAFRRHDNKLTLRSFIIAVASVATGVASVLLLVDNRVAAQTDAGVKVHEQRIQVLETGAREQRAENAATRQEVREMRSELRELYGTVRTGRRSEALEQPVPRLDGGR